MKSLKVQTGKLKGKSIETPPAVAGNTNFTPAIVKKSLFDVVGSLVLKGRLIPEESVFVDFFAGSGQMALEAVSRGFARVVLYELAWERSDSLRKLFDKIGATYEVFRKDVFRFYDKLNVPENSRVYFMDPPYSFWEKKNDKFRLLAEDLLSKENTTAVFVQSPIHPGWDGFEIRKFGKNFLSFKIRETFAPEAERQKKENAEGGEDEGSLKLSGTETVRSDED
ncbi:RsmD family RNA methyltransferase [Leptospira ellisii]|uniref:DNA methyltransferase n=1 Tax=Leptospira ellisii TaxID=2023197 RepID=A0A2N0B967_9LEPT|nr:RsmD family RNA methyltransferase [Leptospira ellisii]MDV6234481.1 RsmD family RNA methyltransferase [Leptospira ellisii]PJZ93094.1 DNA methyltransferase [Leptospira ellisii]PKA03168.1 DNA methyltransferase [Leptospira ellisii]